MDKDVFERVHDFLMLAKASRRQINYKKKSGEVVTRIISLLEADLPEKGESNFVTSASKHSQGLATVYDLTTNKWLSLYVDSVLSNVPVKANEDTTD